MSGIQQIAKGSLAGFSFLCVIAASPAAAQQMADAEALASLEQADTSLTVKAVTDMQFGLVTIPNATRGLSNVVCSYDLRVNPDERLVARTIRESPGFDGAPIVGVSPSGCEFRSVPQVSSAGFEVTCAPSVLTNYQIAWNANTADPAINLLAPPSGVAGFFAAGTGNQVSGTANQNADSGAVICPTAGSVDVLIGGTLQIGQTAIVAANSSVGSISLSVNY